MRLSDPERPPSSPSGRRAVLDLFAVPGFAGLWVSAAAGSFARIGVQLAVSWITLEATGSPFLVGAVLAARMLPLLLLGIPAGAVADAFDRHLLVVLTNGATVIAALLAAGAAAAGLLSFGQILTAALAFGSLDTLRTAATQTYVFDLVREARATRGIALTNVGAQLLGALGALLGGLALERGGATGAFLLVALVGLVGALAPTVGSISAPPRSAAPRARPALGRALGLLARNRLVAAFSLAILLAEILGFSHLTLLPTFARDVFDVGASGLGELTAARSVGGVLSLLLLAGLGTRDRSGRVFLMTGGSLGLALVAFAASPSYPLALVLLAVAGAAASAHDALGQTLLQRSAADRERGAAMGIWVFSIGFAPLGHLGLGAVAAALGAPVAQAISGAALLVVALILAAHAPLRRAA